MVLELFRNPAAFYADKDTEQGLQLELGLLVAIGALGTIGFGWVAWSALGAMSEGRDAEQIQFISEGAVYFLTPLALWLYAGLTTHFISYYFNVRGKISRVLKITAWSLLPLAVGNVALSIGYFLAFRTVDFPEEPPGLHVEDRIEYVLGLGYGEPVWVLAWVVYLLTAIYAAYLLSIGFQQIRNLSERDARIVVTIPFGLYILFVVYTILSQSGFL